MFEFFKKIFSQTISDEEFDALIAENNAIQCPKCCTFIAQQDLEDNNYKCPVCRAKIDIEVLKTKPTSD